MSKLYNDLNTTYICVLCVSFWEIDPGELPRGNKCVRMPAEEDDWLTRIQYFIDEMSQMVF